MSVTTLSRLLLGALALPTLVLANACEPAPAAPHNDNFGAAKVLASAAQGEVSGTTVGATRQSGEPASFTPTTVWFRWTAPTSGAVTFTGSSALPMAIDPYTGSALKTLHAVPLGSSAEEAAFRTTAGTVYSIRVSSLSGSTFGLTWKTSPTPANDRQTAAAAISGSAGSLVSDTLAATSASTDPEIEGAKAPATLWYRWTAPASGWYDFDTHGSQVSTELGVYTDATPAQLIDDNAGDCGGFGYYDYSTTGLHFAAVSGTSYLLMVGGTDADNPVPSSLGGSVQLNWRSAATAPVASGNDAFASPAIVSGTYGSLAGDTEGATAEIGEPAHGGEPARNSVWFAWTPPVTGDYELSAAPTDSNGCAAGLAVYTGSSLATLKDVPSLDDGLTPSADPTSNEDIAFISDLASSAYGLRVHLTAGTTYRIAADRLGSAGAFTLRWDIPQAAPVIRSATPGNGSIGVIWSPPAPTAGSPRTGYFVTVIPVGDDYSTDEPITLPVTSAFTTIHGLKNGSAYRVIVAAINSAGLGDFAVSHPVTPSRSY